MALNTLKKIFDNTGLERFNAVLLYGLGLLNPETTELNNNLHHVPFSDITTCF